VRVLEIAVTIEPRIVQRFDQVFRHDGLQMLRGREIRCHFNFGQFVCTISSDGSIRAGLLKNIAEISLA
jgi:hypothetical protein